MRKAAGLMALLALTGCARASPFRSVERAIARELPERIGPAEQYRVRVSRSGLNLAAGRIPWMEIEGKNVRPPGGLTINELHVRLEGVRFDPSKRVMTSLEEGEFTAAIGAETVTAAIRQRGPRLREVRVRFQAGHVVVDATPALVGIGVPVQVEGHPVLRDPGRIDFAVSRLAVLRIGLPEFAVRRLEAAINPIVDLEAMQLPVRAATVRVDSDRLRVSGPVYHAPPYQGALLPWATGSAAADQGVSVPKRLSP